MTAKHPRLGRVGRVRPPTVDELGDVETLFHPSTVLQLTGPVPPSLPVVAARVASFVDGVRPVARVRSKAGVSRGGLREALASLDGRGLVCVVGIVEEAAGEVAAEIARELAHWRDDQEHTIPRGGADAIPAHVMAEIQAMVVDEEHASAVDDAFDEDTDVFSTTKKSDA